eukprot:Rhum_TRINITY_DN14249_c26_g1::Rhum_TRINITY_DN14249_c26_g1_i1::g.77048::m.77048
MPRERQLFVAGLSAGCTDDDLRLVFEAFGTVELTSVATDQKGNKIGFVTFTDIRNAKVARILHGKTAHGMGPLVVLPALSRSEKNEAQGLPAGGGSGGDGGGSSDAQHDGQQPPQQLSSPPQLQRRTQQHQFGDGGAGGVHSIMAKFPPAMMDSPIEPVRSGGSRGGGGGGGGG